MPDSKAIQILKSLNKEELKQFGRFVQSPYYNRLKDVTRLFLLLKKYYPEFNPDEITNRILFRKLFPSKNYNDTRMRNLISDLGQLSEKFLSIKSFEEDKNFREYTYQNLLLGKKLYGLLGRTLKSAENLIRIDEASEFSLKKYFHAMVLHDYFIDTNRQHESAESAYLKYDSLLEFFLQNMIRGLYDFKVHKNMHAYENKNLLKTFAENFDFDRFMESIDKNHPEIVMLNIVYRVFKLLRDEEFENNLEKLLALINEQESNLAHQFKYDIYLNIHNLLAFRTFEDGLECEALRFKVIKETILKNVYSPDPKKNLMPLRLFANGINLSILCGEPLYADYLLENYCGILESSSATSAGYYALAKIEFHKCDFHKSLEHLSKVDYRIVTLRKHVKNLMLQLYYELGYYDSAESLVISYRQYLNRNDGFIGMYGEWYDNFLKFYSALLKLSGSDNDSKKNLRKKISLTKKVLFKQWMVAKVNL